MITRVSSIEELKQLWVETLLNKTDKITKVSNESILNGTAYGIAKIGQKALKDIALAETHQFPDSAFGVHLDEVANKLGISPRFTASSSSCFIRVVGNPGTTYNAGVHVFSGAGVSFDTTQTVTIGVSGFAYVRVRSQTQGSNTNVDALTINTIQPIPTGHLYCVNEYKANGGRDLENDRDFRLRIKEGANIAATGTTLYKLIQVFQKINPNILRVFYQGVNQLNQPILAVATTNGADLTSLELQQLNSRVIEYVSLIDIPIMNAIAGIEIKNIEYQPIDTSFRVKLTSSAVVDDVRRRIQVVMSKYLDWRYWQTGSKVEWDNLLEMVKNDPDVEYVQDQTFVPSVDIVTDPTKLPRMRGFIMMDLDGNILTNITGTLNPVYYPIDPSLFFQTTVISSI